MVQNKIQFIFCVSEDIIVLRNMNLQKQLSLINDCETQLFLKLLFLIQYNIQVCTTKNTNTISQNLWKTLEILLYLNYRET